MPSFTRQYGGTCDVIHNHPSCESANRDADGSISEPCYVALPTCYATLTPSQRCSEIATYVYQMNSAGYCGCEPDVLSKQTGVCLFNPASSNWLVDDIEALAAPRCGILSAESYSLDSARPARRPRLEVVGRPAPCTVHQPLQTCRRHRRQSRPQA